MLGLYIHIPFCVQKCKYCDFNSYKIEKDKKEKQAKADRWKAYAEKESLHDLETIRSITILPEKSVRIFLVLP